MALVAILEKRVLFAPEALERLEQIQHEADWMSTLLADRGPDRESVSVADVGAVVSESWAAVAAFVPCTVRLVRESATDAVLDPVGLGRAVRNLVDNAVRAVGADGCVEVRVWSRGLEVLVEVADSGPGFGRVPAQQGLGLVTVRRFLSGCGGSLHVGTSELGGALVAMRLPRAGVVLGVEDGEPA